MPYTPTQWKDRAVEKPRTYRIQENPDGTVTLIPEPGTVYEAGTTVTAARLNNLETGIDTAHDILDAATNAATPNTIAKRDSAGRMKAAAPSASDDVARKAETDAAYNRGVTAEQNAIDYAVNKIAAYGGGTPIDPNTTAYPYIITNHPNVPTGSGYWHIRTYFYQDTNSNRAQVAIRYIGSVEMYFRKMVSGAWENWSKVWHDGILPDPARTGVNNNFSTTQSITSAAAEVIELIRTTNVSNVAAIMKNQNNDMLAFGMVDGNTFGIGPSTNLIGESKFRVNKTTGEATINGNSVWHAGNLNPNQVGRAAMIPIYHGIPLSTSTTSSGNTNVGIPVGDELGGMDLSGLQFLWDAAYAAGRQVYFEVLALGGTTTAYYALRNAAGTLFGQVSTASSSIVRLRSGALSLPSGTVLYPCMWTSNSSSLARLYAARLVII